MTLIQEVAAWQRERDLERAGSPSLKNATVNWDTPSGGKTAGKCPVESNLTVKCSHRITGKKAVRQARQRLLVRTLPVKRGSI